MEIALPSTLLQVPAAYNELQMSATSSSGINHSPEGHERKQWPLHTERRQSVKHTLWLRTKIFVATEKMQKSHLDFFLPSAVKW